MTEMQARSFYAPQYTGQEKSFPVWIPILVVAILIVIPLVVFFAYVIYTRRRGDMDQPTTPAPANIDVERQSPSEAPPSAGKWSMLTVPGWNSQASAERRGSDGGFPPGTRHITFPDPTFSTSTDSLDYKAPPNLGPASVIDPVTLKYPTPPAVAARPDGRYNAPDQAF